MINIGGESEILCLLTLNINLNETFAF